MGYKDKVVKKPTYLNHVDSKVLEKVVIVEEKDRFVDDFKAPAQYYIINGMGDAVYFKTRSRSIAQEMSDTIYGKGHYTVRVEMKAAIR